MTVFFFFFKKLCDHKGWNECTNSNNVTVRHRQCDCVVRCDGGGTRGMYESAEARIFVQRCVTCLLWVCLFMCVLAGWCCRGCGCGLCFSHQVIGECWFALLSAAAALDCHTFFSHLQFFLSFIVSVVDKHTLMYALVNFV